MAELPFSIPESLFSYVEQYQAKPEKTTGRLKKQLKKRGHDAVGYFLLAWFYHRRGCKEEALECAIKAKIFAPGSPFFKKVHYFFTHPDLFEAWAAPSSMHANNRYSSHSATASSLGVLELDQLIDKLSKIETTRIQPNLTESSESSSSLIESSTAVDDIVSETLASIHEKQGNTAAAIDTYQRLQHIHPDKEEHYQKEVKRLKKLKKKKDPK